MSNIVNESLSSAQLELDLQSPRQKKLSISECFGPTIQGEGALIGKPTVFVRTGGCDYRCQRCDTLYAVLPEHRAAWQQMTTQEVFTQVRELAHNRPILVTLSGGNPAMQPLEELIDLGHAEGYTFAIETQGSIAQPWFAKLDYLTLSPKAPGMQNPQPTNWERLDRCISYARQGHDGKQPGICLKIVIFDEEDYQYAKHVAERYPNIPLYLQAGNHTPPHLANEIDINGILSRMDWLIQRVVEDQWYEVTILPQLHTLLWGNKRGV
ncbi:7-carboxy-7-deazaguanine synthase [Ktedonobacter sp. SOSP1-85]|uniref:7-carboxy-7-deazaguanine synthase QueE n=1 Tax=Ktedonobacter sp. SOSP1-85 TaxID=2778367 RepID=UPI001A233084|nr:7-carboxy-7-deazaguanine synthase QueE [Ktedonobacter sp. SOSP1-85]GHO81376.1 7-carboxy-7-deazaguanine synthase [Ktedonobacter sp. SOSP1-85]